MNPANTGYIWTAELVSLAATLAAFFYGAFHFFKKRKPLYLQSITMAMGCHSLGSIYHACLSLTALTIPTGFTPAYLGRMGFFLFFIAASYGQMDRIVDDGSKLLRKSRRLALLAPILVLLLYLPVALASNLTPAAKISYLAVWIPAAISMYFNLKHSILPNIDFGFVKAIKPFNVYAVFLGFSELLCLMAMSLGHHRLYIALSFVFGALCVSAMFAAKKGVEKWTI